MKLLRLLPLVFASLWLFSEEPLLPAYTCEHDTTDLGATVVSVDLPGNPETAVVVTIKGGVFGEGSLLGSGLASLAAEWLEGKMNSARVAEGSSMKDVSVSVEADRTALFVSISGIKEQVKEALGTLFGFLADPEIGEEEFQRLRDNTTAYLSQKEGTDKFALIDLWRRTAFPAMAEAVPKEGFSAQMSKLSREDLAGYLKTHCLSGNLNFVLAGSLFGSGLKELALASLERLPKGVLLRDDRVVVTEGGGANFALRTAKGTKSLVCAGFVLRPSYKDTAPSELAAELIKRRGPELEKLLADEFQKRVEVFFSQEKEAEGLSLKVFCEIAPEQSQKCRSLISKWLTSFAGRKFSDAEVRECSDVLLSDLAAACARPLSLARMLSISVLEKGGPFALQQKAGSLNETGSEKVRAYAAKNLTANCLTLCWSDPEEDLAPQAAEFLKLEREILENIGYQSYRTALPGKAELLVQKREDETLVRCAFAALGGNWYEETFNNGIFALLSEFLASGSGESEAFLKAARECGAKIEPLFEPQVAGFTVTVPVRNFTKLLPYLCRAWSDPKFSDASLMAAKGRVLQRETAQNTNAALSAELLARQTLFPDHTYGLERFGNPFVLERAKTSDLESFYNEYITPDNTEIILSGPVDDKAAMLTILSEMREFLAKGNKRSQNGRNGTRPRLLPLTDPSKEAKRETEKDFVSPDPNAMIVYGRELPGYEADPALPYLVCYSMRRALDASVAGLIEKHGRRAVLDSGFSAYPGYGTGYAYLWLKVKPELLDESDKTLAERCGVIDGELLGSASFEKLRSDAASSSALYGRASEEFMKRALRRALFSTNEWGELGEQISSCSLASVSNALLRCGAPVKVIVRPEAVKP